jgi:SAM-dependent methyltransferase
VDIYRIYRLLGRNFRAKRLRWLQAHFRDCSSVLDIGGISANWKAAEWIPPHLTLLNLNPYEELISNALHIEADALAIPFPDQCFDLAMANSVIEHVPDQVQFAAEMMRVGKRLYCQTPSKWFPIEPHYLGLFVHWLPKRWFTHFCHRYLTIHGIVAKPDLETTVRLKQEIHLLGKEDLRRLFPGCEIKTERFAGLPKSYVIYR